MTTNPTRTVRPALVWHWVCPACGTANEEVAKHLPVLHDGYHVLPEPVRVRCMGCYAEFGTGR